MGRHYWDTTDSQGCQRDHLVERKDHMLPCLGIILWCKGPSTRGWTFLVLDSYSWWHLKKGQYHLHERCKGEIDGHSRN